jgi:type IV pilus assembly protein PilA
MTTLRIPNRRQRPNGFTLMELLIVISIMLILMLIAIPNFNKIKMTANENSAIKSLQVIGTAEQQYSSSFPANGYSCTLPALGGDPSKGNPTPTLAELIPDSLAAGVKDGYQFTISNCSKQTVGSTDNITGYTVTATPLAVGKTGNRGFCTDQFNQIKYDPAGGTNCTQSMQ